MKLLIVVDYQTDFVNGSLGFKQAQELENKIYNKIKEFENDEVIYTLDTHESDYLNTLEGKNLPILHCLKNTKGHELYGKIKSIKKLNDKTFTKNTFGSLELANYLANKDYEFIEIVGVVSNICVLCNAIMVRSALPNTLIRINKNLVASNDLDLEKKAFDIMKSLFIEVYDE